VFSDLVRDHLAVVEKMLNGSEEKEFFGDFEKMIKTLKVKESLYRTLMNAWLTMDDDFIKVFRLCLYSRALLGIDNGQFGTYDVDNDLYSKVVYAISIYANKNLAKYRMISTGMFYGQGMYDCGYFNEGIQYMGRYYSVDPICFVREMLDLKYIEIKEDGIESEGDFRSQVVWNDDISEDVCPVETEVKITEYNNLFFVSTVDVENLVIVDESKVDESPVSYEIHSLNYEKIREEALKDGAVQLLGGEKPYEIRVQNEVVIKFKEETSFLVMIRQWNDVSKRYDYYVERDMSTYKVRKFNSYVSGSNVFELKEGKLYKRRPPEIVKIWFEAEILDFSVKTVVLARFRDKGKFFLTRSLNEWKSLYVELGWKFFRYISTVKGAYYSKNFLRKLKDIILNMKFFEGVMSCELIRKILSSDDLDQKRAFLSRSKLLFEDHDATYGKYEVIHLQRRCGLPLRITK
jgi:hypothetical protein